jgi:hypothetical protein
MGVATLRCGPLVASVPCAGDLSQPVEFDAQVLRALIKAPPAGKSIDVSVEGGRLRFGPVTTRLVA